jgi:hypothetical protein
MKCYTISGGQRSAWIQAEKPKYETIDLGEAGRGRKLVRVPIPHGSVQDGARLYETPGAAGTLIRIRDHSGYRGGWKLTAPRAPEEYDMDIGDRPDRRKHEVHVVAEGWCAQGDAGRMGGGPDLLVRMHAGESAEISRTGRLYGQPAVWRIDVGDDGTIEVSDPIAARASQRAAGRML